MGKVILVKTNGKASIETVDFESKDSSTNARIKELIGDGCNYYEMTPSVFLNHHFKTELYPSESGKYGYALLIDEEGKLTKRPFNEFATIICANSYDTIVGNAVIVAITKDAVSSEWDFCGLPDETINYLKEILNIEE